MCAWTTSVVYAYVQAADSCLVQHSLHWQFAYKNILNHVSAPQPSRTRPSPQHVWYVSGCIQLQWEAVRELFS